MELKKRIDFSRNGAGISQDPCKKKKSGYWKQYISQN